MVDFSATRRWAGMMGVCGALLLAPGVGLSLEQSTLKQPTKQPTHQELGKILWERHCQMCHGAMARGDGPAASQLVTPVPDLYHKITRDRVEDLIRTIMRGENGHPAYQTTFDLRDKAKAVLDHMVALDVSRMEKEDGEKNEATTPSPESKRVIEASKRLRGEATRKADPNAAPRKKADDDAPPEGNEPKGADGARD